MLDLHESGEIEKEVRRMGIDFASGYFTCPYCGNGVFRCYPQTVRVGAKMQTWEYTCTKCNMVTAMVQEEADR